MVKIMNNLHNHDQTSQQKSPRRVFIQYRSRFGVIDTDIRFEGDKNIPSMPNSKYISTNGEVGVVVGGLTYL